MAVGSSQATSTAPRMARSRGLGSRSIMEGSGEDGEGEDPWMQPWGLSCALLPRQTPRGLDQSARTAGQRAALGLSSPGRPVPENGHQTKDHLLAKGGRMGWE